MGAIISKKTFVKMEKNSSFFDKNGKRYFVEIANCEEPSDYPTHLVGDYQDNFFYLFHDGKNIRIMGLGNKELNGAIVEEFTL